MNEMRPPTDEEIGAFIDREATVAERAATAERLLAHPEAQARLRTDRALKEALLEELAAFDPAPGDYALEADALAMAKLRSERRTGWRRVTAAAALVAAGWGGHMGYAAWRDSQVPSLVEDAAQAHQVFAYDHTRPVETHNAAALSAWFSEHLGEPVVIPDLSAAGLRFIGGRLLATDNGALGLVIYEDGVGRRLSLYIAEDNGSDIDEMEIVRLEEVDAGYWRDGGVTYAVVAESSVEQVLQVASVIGIAPDHAASIP
jgi:anti-sigma factor RsiW